MAIPLIQPEQHPERARALLEARRRLLHPDTIIERELGQIRAPDPKAWGLERRSLEVREQVALDGRLLGQALLYTMIEDALLE